MGQLGQELVQLLLALAEFSTTAVVDAEGGHDAVNDEETVVVGGEIDAEVIQELQLMLHTEI